MMAGVSSSTKKPRSVGPAFECKRPNARSETTSRTTKSASASRLDREAEQSRLFRSAPPTPRKTGAQIARYRRRRRRRPPSAVASWVPRTLDQVGADQRVINITLPGLPQHFSSKDRRRSCVRLSKTSCSPTSPVPHPRSEYRGRFWQQALHGVRHREPGFCSSGFRPDADRRFRHIDRISR